MNDFWPKSPIFGIHKKTTMKIKYFVGLVLAFSVAAGCGIIDKKSKKKDASAQVTPSKKKEDGMKTYAEVITKEAKSDTGLFQVHKIDDKFYYEIGDSMLNRQMLMVTRIAKTATNLGYGGENIDNQVVRWERFEDKILLRLISFNNVASDSLPVYQSVQNSNFEPIIESFDIKALSADSNGIVIDVTGLWSTDVKPFGLNDGARKQYKVSVLDAGRSFIKTVKSYPTNIEVRKVFTYKSGKAPSNSELGALSLEISNSMILLPEKPMTPRIFDQRVGFFSTSQVDFGLEDQKATRRTYIVRWRLEPKDPEAYFRGELVEPVKQIVYYIDPATPVKWRKYLKQGVNDWQKAFEAAGFKNAIIAKDAPTPEEDPDWSPEDARYSVIRYFASDIQNAYGPNVHDPRSGEILESDIGWYHNVMNLLRNWYFVQTAAINPNAQMTEFDEEVMGRLIRFVSSHEVGHTLGFPHNMGGSFAYPTDSLRSASFTNANGTAPSIMDYARFNYVAQPEDKGVNLFPGIGTYDKWAAKWGYSILPDAKTADDEKETLNAWILEKAGKAEYRFGRQTFNPIDPRSQTEDLGNDAMKSSTYGIANLKRIVPNLVEWTGESGKNYDDLDELYGQVLGQWRRYMGHVKSNIGGIYEDYKTFEQEGVVYTPVPANVQREAMGFISEQAFQTPTWMLEKEVLDRIEGAETLERIRGIQSGVLNTILDQGRLARVIETEAMFDGSSYGLLELFSDVRSGIWTELKGSGTIDAFRRNLQRAYLERMDYLMTKEQQSVPAAFRSFYGLTPIDVSLSDIRPAVRGELKTLERDINRALPRVTDRMTKYHLEDALIRIDNILNPKK
ncbi:MAG: hypothetical protein ACJATA_001510 [Sphingobacteriales bacterium]|jgi:hypothetical protein